jgi:E3 ubiquitin-protein ligase RFWD2
MRRILLGWPPMENMLFVVSQFCDCIITTLFMQFYRSSGSENNRLYLYYKQVPDPLLSFDCAHHSVDSPPMTTAAAADGTSGESTSTPTQFAHQPAPPNGEFVSAVCWKRNSNVILAANSQGQTFVLELQ